MDVVAFARILAPGPDTTTTELGTRFPEEPTVLVLSLPDLIFDGGVGTTSNTLPQFGDRQDGNDTRYRFFFSTAPDLEVVDDNNATEVKTADGARYDELESGGRAVQLLTRDLSAGTYYLYVTSEVTGRIPLARSRGLLVRHGPSVLSVGPVDGPVILDSGGLFDTDSLANGNGTQKLDVTFAAVDHDDTVTVSLFYSSEAGLQATDVVADVDGVIQVQAATVMPGARDLTARPLPLGHPQRGHRSGRRLLHIRRCTGGK